METVRDFLIEKLRSAELTLKSTMNENVNLKKQSSADQEVISYLDLRGQELESGHVELQKNYEQMKAAMELQSQSYSSMEAQLSREVLQLKEQFVDLDTSSKAQKVRS